jgi:hypothetical protein
MDMTELTIDRNEYRRYYVTSLDKWYVGFDVGQSIDPSAICALNYKLIGTGEMVPNDKTKTFHQGYREEFHVRHLERLKLGTPYPNQVEYVCDLLTRSPLDKAEFALDYTGCGRPVADMFVRALRGIRKVNQVLITSGFEVVKAGLNHHVPKTHLCSQLEARMHSQELKVAPQLRESPALKSELQDFVRKVSESGRMQWGARSGAHDDLILSMAIAVYLATNRTTVTRSELS